MSEFTEAQLQDMESVGVDLRQYSNMLCKNCDGKGTLWVNAVRVLCMTCRGTGKVAV